MLPWLEWGWMVTDEHDDALEMMPAKPSEVSSRGKTPEMRGKEGEGGWAKKRGHFEVQSTVHRNSITIILNTFKV